MLKTEFFKVYKIPILLSLTYFVAVMAFKTERELLNIILIFAGSLLGTFLLDVDYLIHAYFIEPEKPNSDLIKDYVKHKDLAGLLLFTHAHKNEFEDLTLNSALFQLILGAASIFVMTANITVFLKIFIAAAFVNSIYRFIEEYMAGNTKNWFWSFKMELRPTNIYFYLLLLLAVAVYGVYVF